MVGRWLADHLLTTYQPLTNCLPTTYQPPTDHLPTTYRPPTDHLPTTYRPPTDHLPTTYRPLTDHLPTPTYQPPTNHPYQPHTNCFFTVQLVQYYPLALPEWVILYYSPLSYESLIFCKLCKAAMYSMSNGHAALKGLSHP